MEKSWVVHVANGFGGEYRILTADHTIEITDSRSCCGPVEARAESARIRQGDVCAAVAVPQDLGSSSRLL